MSFWKEQRPKTRRPAPTCKTHGTPKVRQTAKTPYRCPACEREAWEREAT